MKNTAFLVFLYVDSTTVINLELQDHLGSRETLRWCEKAFNGVPGVVDRLLSSETLKLPVVRSFAQRFDWQFDGNGALIEAARGLAIEAMELSSEWCNRTKETTCLLEIPSVEEDPFQESLMGFENRPTQTLSHAQANFFLEMLHRWVSGDVMKELHPETWQIEALLSSIQILKVASTFLNMRPQTTLKGKMESLTSRLCRLQDVEMTTPYLKDETPITCAIIDTIEAYATCGTELWKPQLEGCSNPPVPPGFPKDICYAPASVAQRTLGHNDVQTSEAMRLRAFSWKDPKVRISLLLTDARPLPSLISTKTRNAELLTYLALYRGIMAFYQMSHTPLHLCSPSQVASMTLIPGWTVVQVFTTTHPHDPSFKKQRVSMSYNRIPSVIVAEAKCQFAVGVRGTVLPAEWYTNFLFRESILPLQHTYDVDGIPTVSQGYLSVATRFLPGIISAIERRSAFHQCVAEKTKITFFGHSMGAAVSQILSLLTADRYNGTGVMVQGVYFAGPRAFNKAAAKIYAHLVNGRSLTDLGDPLFYVPCYEDNSLKGMARCGRGHYLPAGSGADTWAAVPGFVMLDSGVKSILETQKLQSAVEDSEVLERLIKESAVEVIEAQGVASEGVLNLSFLYDRIFAPSNPMTRVIYDVLSKALSKLLIPLRALKSMPTKAEFRAAHTFSFGCALSTACHGLPWSEFRWWCDQLE